MIQVDVIIPVYKGLTETKRCIESVLQHSQKTKFELVVIDDASPEPEVSNYLLQASKNGEFTLLQNEINLGFVGTVNRGMSLHQERDVLLLNSDTCVTNRWLDKIYESAYRDDTIGTVTPFSNNATICSYPNFPNGGELPKDVTLSELDNIASEINSGYTVDIPTAVGFCMFIKRNCLNEVGLFDQEKFGKGYGEENDFSFRAAKKGWRNVISTDTFVFHEGSVSFGESKLKQIEHSSKVIRKLYPAYDKIIQQFIKSDPIKISRFRITLARLRISGLPLVMLVSHDRGGGVQKHINDLQQYLSDQVNFLYLRRHKKNCFELRLLKEDENFSLYFYLPEEAQLLIETLVACRIDRVHIHHLLDTPSDIFTIIDKLGVPFDFTVHDFFAYCPQIHLHDANHSYCGEPEISDCERCLMKRPVNNIGSVKEWRIKNQDLLSRADRVFVPSQIVADRINHFFPKIATTFANHIDAEVINLNPTVGVKYPVDGKVLKILLLGALSEIKGATILYQTAQLAKEKMLPLQFHLLGYGHLSEITDYLLIHGKYDESNLQQKLDEIKPHIVWFPAQVPETYSYTLSIALKLGLPVVVSNLGALQERIAGRQWSWVMPWDSSKEVWADFFIQILNNHFLPDIKPETTAGIIKAPVFSYLKEYTIKRVRSNNISLPSNLNQILLKCIMWRRQYKYGFIQHVEEILIKSILRLSQVGLIKKLIITCVPDQKYKNFKKTLNDRI